MMDKASGVKRAVIFANGELADAAAAKAEVRPGDLLAAADGGMNHMARLGLKPDLLVGDLDSIEPALLFDLQSQGVRILRHPAEKDETDLELTLVTLASEGYRQMRLVGTLGGRLDHTLGNLFLLLLPELVNCDVRLVDGLQEVFLIRREGVVEGQPGDTVSLLPLLGPATGVATEGLYYPLKEETLKPERTRGISNLMLGQQARIRLSTGCLLCIHMRQK